MATLVGSCMRHVSKFILHRLPCGPRRVLTVGAVKADITTRSIHTSSSFSVPVFQVRGADYFGFGQSKCYLEKEGKKSDNSDGQHVVYSLKLIGDCMGHDMIKASRISK